MNITIIGAGALGSHLARYLSEEQLDIYIVDRDITKLSMLDSENNLMTVVGDAIDLNVLRQAKTGSCDLFIAVTEVADRNFVACGLAKWIGAKMGFVSEEINIQSNCGWIDADWFRVAK